MKWFACVAVRLFRVMMATGACLIPIASGFVVIVGLSVSRTSKKTEEKK